MQQMETARFDADGYVAWPFPVKEPPDGWSEFHRDLIDFMQTGYGEGFQPSHRCESAVQARNSSNRHITLLIRGRRNGWEPILAEGDRSFRLGPKLLLPECTAIFIRPPFRNAAYFALEWLRDRSIESLLSNFCFDGKRSLTRL
jgi:hypothetical protein